MGYSAERRVLEPSGRQISEGTLDRTTEPAAELADDCELCGAAWLGHGRCLPRSSRRAPVECREREGFSCSDNRQFRARLSLYTRHVERPDRWSSVWWRSV